MSAELERMKQEKQSKEEKLKKRMRYDKLQEKG